MDKSQRKKILNPRTPWEVLYDFLDEIFAMMIPGAFFLSYFFCVVFIVVQDLDVVNSFAAHMSVALTLVVFSVAYCFGALFHRMEIKKVDTASARRSYHKMPHGSGHSFAFANALTNAYLIRVIRIIQFHALLSLQKAGIVLNKEAVLKPQAEVKPETQQKQTLLCDQPQTAQGFASPVEQPQANPSAQMNGAKACGECPSMVELYKIAGGDCLETLNQLVYDHVTETCKNCGTHLTLTSDELLPALSSMLLLNVSDNIHLHRCKEELQSRLVRINDFLTIKGFPGLKQLVEECLWEKIALLYRDNAVADSSATRYLHPILKVSIFQPLLTPSPAFSAKRNLNTLQNLLKAIQRIHKQVRATGNQGAQHSYLWRIQSYIQSDIADSIDWPYTHMKRYCTDRGLEYANEVTWGDGAIHETVLDEIGLTTDPSLSEEINRSKSRINTDKMDITEKEPLLYRMLMKNEAHIRFMNGIWYASQHLLWSAVVIMVLSILDYVLSPDIPFLISLTRAKFFYMIVTSVAFIVICFSVRRSVLEILHYQRVRELNMILKAKSIIRSKAEKKKAPAVPAQSGAEGLTVEEDDASLEESVLMDAEQD